MSQLRKGTLEYCVLALLDEGERYGFELVRTLSEADGLMVSEGTIYPLLSRLRRDLMVETSWQESESGPPRRYYHLTEAGRLLAERLLKRADGSHAVRYGQVSRLDPLERRELGRRRLGRLRP